MASTKQSCINCDRLRTAESLPCHPPSVRAADVTRKHDMYIIVLDIYIVYSHRCGWLLSGGVMSVNDCLLASVVLHSIRR
jgi:hypothetical protein